MPNQSFLPIYEPLTKKLHGLVAISTTNFVGTETSFAIGGVNYTVVKNTPVVSQPTQSPWYMALTMTHAEFKAEAYHSIPGFIHLNEVLPGAFWNATISGAQKVENLGALINGLLFSFGGNFTVEVEDPPTVADSTPDVYWVAQVPFVDYPQCTFFDFNWVAAAGLDNEEGAPVRLVINTVYEVIEEPQDKIKAVVVMTKQPALNRATYDTIRIVRMPNAVLEAGAEFYVDATIYGQNGYTQSVLIKLTIQ